MKVYIAGAITNNPRYKERFEYAKEMLARKMVEEVKQFMTFDLEDNNDKAVPYPILHSYLKVVATK